MLVLKSSPQKTRDWIFALLYFFRPAIACNIHLFAAMNLAEHSIVKACITKAIMQIVTESVLRARQLGRMAIRRLVFTIQTVAGYPVCGDWSWNHFYGRSLPITDSSRAGVSYWRRVCTKYWLKVRSKPAQEKYGFNWPSRLDMSIVVDWDIKPQNKQKLMFTNIWMKVVLLYYF